MNIPEFITKWQKVELTERAAAQQHFLDLCELVGHPKPAQADPTGESFTFERGASIHGGGEGWADVWKKGFFGWEYKGKHKDLDAAYDQLLNYRESLENPPLLVVCDMDKIIVHTNFTSTAVRVYEIPLAELGAPRNLEILRAVFDDPDKLKPGTTSEAITAEAASHLAPIAQTMRDRGLPPHDVARMLDRVIFCLFAEDIGLLPAKVFTTIVDKAQDDPKRFTRLVGQLFDAMAHGGDFGPETIRHFNGNLFDSTTVMELTADEIESIHRACLLDWSAVDPSVFGTLFERGLDPDKRSQLGAHYTSRADIETLVEPVVMQPLRREWAELRQTVLNLLATGKKRGGGRGTGILPVSGVCGTGRGTGVPPVVGESGSEHGQDARATSTTLSPAQRRKARLEADKMVKLFQHRLATVKVLDPACGSGNFLYVTLQKLMDLEKEVILFSMQHLGGGLLPRVRPEQVYGIEINSYAFELAQMAVWIGYLQWSRQNGFAWGGDPVLTRMDNFQCKDAILDLTDPEHPKEPDWPAVDFIVSNPPFLGDKLMRAGLGDDYVNKLRTFYANRVPGGADLCCYWFEKARQHVLDDQVKRAGLLATQGIRGGANRKVLERIKESGDIFFAESDRPWILDGANVHVSMAAFDKGEEKSRTLDGRSVPVIHPNLSCAADISKAPSLPENRSIAFLGSCKGGSFDIEESEALDLLNSSGNPHGKPNSDVIRPVFNSDDLLKGRGGRWIIDNAALELSEAALYERPHSIVEQRVKPARDANRDRWLRENWWRPQRMRPEMRKAVAALERFIVTTTTSKHRIFLWLSMPALPDHQLIVFARSDDYFFGVLHSRVHELWARALGTQLRERESGFRYTPTTCFETFPFPEICGTGVPPVSGEESRIEHGQDARATSNHGQDGRATDACATAPALQIRQGAYLPHWTLEGSTYFVTFRLGDSLPQEVLEGWITDRESIRKHAAEAREAPSESERSRLEHLVSERVEAYLDAGHGACWLKNVRVAQAVQGALLHFDGDRYEVLAWCIMPNHLHVVVRPRPGHELASILHSWKSFTAKKANELIGRQGEFWQAESYDHLVRDEKDLERCMEYTYRNAERSGVADWPWRGLRGTGVPPVEESGFEHGQDARATDARATIEAIGAAAKELDTLRNNWLNPPEWTREEVLEFPGSVDGPWARYVQNPDSRGIGTVRYPRIVAKDADCATLLKKRTLTTLYNERPTWLDLAHHRLDEAVFAAYGWDPALTGDQILEKLLELNLGR